MRTRSLYRGPLPDPLPWPFACAPQVCYGDGEYCISRHCKKRHFYCSDCIAGTLNATIEMGQFPAHCPSCRSEDPNGHDASKKLDCGLIDGEALSFLQLRGVIPATTHFRFIKAAALSAGDKTTGDKYFACPSGCGQYLVDDHPSYTSSLYKVKLGEFLERTSARLQLAPLHSAARGVRASCSERREGACHAQYPTRTSWPCALGSAPRVPASCARDARTL